MACARFGAYGAGGNADAGTQIGSFGIRFATDTCGQLSPEKLRTTVCEYWIWVYVTVIGQSAAMSYGAVTSNLATGFPAAELPSTVTVWPALHGGTVICSLTVS